MYSLLIWMLLGCSLANFANANVLWMSENTYGRYVIAFFTFFFVFSQTLKLSKFHTFSNLQNLFKKFCWSSNRNRFWSVNSISFVHFVCLVSRESLPVCLDRFSFLLSCKKNFYNQKANAWYLHTNELNQTFWKLLLYAPNLVTKKKYVGHLVRLAEISSFQMFSNFN